MRNSDCNKFNTSLSINLVNAKPIVKQQGFYTYSSFYQNKQKPIRSTNHDTQSASTLIKEFSILQMMRRKSMIKESANNILYQRNMDDILNLIKHQRRSHSPKRRAINKQKRLVINENCMNVYDSINQSAQMPKQAINNGQDNIITKRSMSHQLSSQPMRVKIMKRMLLFIKNRQFSPSEQGLRNRNKNNDAQQQCLKSKRKAKLSPLYKNLQSNSFNQTQSNVYNKSIPNELRINRKQSLNCKGQILSKQDGLVKRKNRLRQYNLKQVQIQPIFLQQF